MLVVTNPTGGSFHIRVCTIIVPITCFLKPLFTVDASRLAVLSLFSFQTSEPVSFFYFWVLFHVVSPALFLAQSLLQNLFINR